MKNINPYSLTLPNDQYWSTGLPLFLGMVFFMENLKTIPGFSNYKTDEFGNIYSYYKFRRLSNELRKIKHSIRKRDGRCYVTIKSDSGKMLTRHTHKLVALSHLPNPNNFKIVMHLDNNPQNNHISNLKWGTSHENNLQAYRQFRKKPNIKLGLENYNTKFDIETIKEILLDYVCGIKKKDIKMKYKISKSTLYRMVRGKSYLSKVAINEIREQRQLKIFEP